MARYSDLSRYEYMPESVPEAVEALNVGWLDAGEAFPRGEVPQEFVEALGVLCRDDPQMRMRGWQGCELAHPGEEETYPVLARVGGQELALGSAEVRVVADDGTWLVAPDLVLHYVTCHHYLPPQAFIEAVVARRSVSALGS